MDDDKDEQKGTEIVGKLGYKIQAFGERPLPFKKSFANKSFFIA
jgi:hypothetical protein